MLNIYQTDPSGNVGNPSDKDDNSDSGTGARGEPATAERKNEVKNVNVTQEGTTHGNIQQKQEKIILNGLGVQ